MSNFMWIIAAVCVIGFFFLRKPSFKRLLAAAERGNPEALFKIGRCYALGKGVEEDMERAIFYTLQAAKLDYFPAQFMMGMLYKSKNDWDNARGWLSKASFQEHERTVPYKGATRELGKLLHEFGQKQGNIELQADGLQLLITAGRCFHDKEAASLAHQIISYEHDVEDAWYRRNHPETEENIQDDEVEW